MAPSLAGGPQAEVKRVGEERRMRRGEALEGWLVEDPGVLQGLEGWQLGNPSHLEAEC